MSKLFWIPFTTGVFHNLAIQQKKEKQWFTTNAILGTNALYQSFLAIREEYSVNPEHRKTTPTKFRPAGFVASTLFAATIHTGAFFCLGHLLTKKAYPVLADQ